jgi:hypothetical protein
LEALVFAEGMSPPSCLSQAESIKGLASRISDYSNDLVKMEGISNPFCFSYCSLYAKIPVKYFFISSAKSGFSIVPASEYLLSSYSENYTCLTADKEKANSTLHLA